MKRFVFPVVVVSVSLGFLFLLNCSKNEQEVNVKSVELLKLESTFSIDSSGLSGNTDVFFSDFSRDPDGSIYLLDGDSVRVYLFNKSGRILGSFLKKGEGPGEFFRYPKLQLIENYLWVKGRRKIGKFWKTGEFIEEYKQKSYFSAIHVVDEIHFLGTKERFPVDRGSKSVTVKILGLFTLENENLTSNYFETESNGRIFIPVGKRRISVFPGDGLVQDLKFGFNPGKEEVVYADTKYYKVYSENLRGNTVSDFSLKTESVSVSKELKDILIKSFGKIQDDLKKKVYAALPGHFCAIKKIRVLHNHSILIESLSTGGKPVFNFFNEKGKLLKRFRIDPGFKFHTLKFFGNRIGMIEDRDESSIYHEFKISDSLFK